MKISVVTTFNQSGYEKYGRNMINSFIKNWPEEVTLYAYSENCQVVEQAKNLVVRDLHSSSPELVSFKQKWKDDPRATGNLATGPIGKGGKQPGIGFRWDAVRFSHKVYAIFHCAKNCESDILLWMDADTICHSPINLVAIEQLIPKEQDICFLGRENKWSECGLYSMNLKNLQTLDFLREFQRMYDHAETGIFRLTEWHDSFVFDDVRLRMPFLKQHDWSRGLIKGEGHPLINSAWGAYLDHLKGARKDLGKSKITDLRVNRQESYWVS